MTLIPIAEWLPDQPTFQGGAREALNVFPALRSYLKMPGLVAFSLTPLSARAQGAFYCRDESTAHRAVQVAGDATKLYLLVGTAWTDASRLVGGAYTTGADAFWDYDQFGNIVVAVNGFDDPQMLDVDATPGVNFVLLPGSPPTGARYVCTIGDFVVLANVPTNSRTVTWSALGDGQDYVASAVTQADSQDIPSGGSITGLFGYEYGGLILQENAIRRMDYEGSPLIFRFKRIAEGIGATIPGSVAGHGDRCFFWHRSGPFMVVGGSEIVPIGEEKVARWFWDDDENGIDTQYLSSVSSAIDPVNKIWACLYAGRLSSGLRNRMIMFHWQTGKWARAEPGTLEMIYSGTAQTGLTLEDLDVYGTLDALPFSLDSPVWAGAAVALFAGFNSSHNLGYFNGPTLAPTVETVEAQIIDGRRARVRSVRAMVNGDAVPSVSLGYRNLQHEDVTYSSAVIANAQGFSRFNRRARYHRARITLAAASDWENIFGVDEVVAKPGGKR